MRRAWDGSKGLDGYVSWEVDPDLAYDREGTTEEAKRLHDWIDEPNLYVKIPATEPGLGSIEDSIAAGRSINVTLIFGLERHREVIEAYIRGVERFVESGGDPSKVRSVASFFVSRVDTEADKRLEAIGSEQALALRGRLAVANAKLAYRQYQELFQTDRWKALEAKGAHPQRCLWASTSTKNPEYRDVLYVEELIGPDTVNTMPEETIVAFQDHGRVAVTLTRASTRPSGCSRSCARSGIDYDDVTRVLEEEGVREVLRLVPRAQAGDRREAQRLRDRMTEAADLVQRIWARDPTVWTGGDEAQWLGWLDEPLRMWERIEELEVFAESAVAAFDHAVVMGMGGSSLAPEVLRRSFASESVHVLDTTHPQAIRRLADSLDLGRTLFIASSKSGSTLETRSHLELFWERAGGNPEQFVAITDPGSALGALAAERGFRATFAGEPTIGGRYSALSVFGLVPAALMGVDLSRLLERTQEMLEACHLEEGNPGLDLGLALGEGWREGRDKIVLNPNPGGFGLWVEQLIAESTGKHGKGLVPAPGEGEDGRDRQAHEVRVSNPYELGQEFFRWEFAVAVAGSILEINPFDQPDVQAAKDKTNEVLAGGDVAVEPGGLARRAAGRRRSRRSTSRSRRSSIPHARGARAADRALPRDGLRRDPRARAALPALDGPAAQGRPARGALRPGRRRAG